MERVRGKGVGGGVKMEGEEEEGQVEAGRGKDDVPGGGGALILINKRSKTCALCVLATAHSLFSLSTLVCLSYPSAQDTYTSTTTSAKVDLVNKKKSELAFVRKKKKVALRITSSPESACMPSLTLANSPSPRVWRSK